MKPLNKIWINGKIAPLAHANLLSFHQGLNYGACVYDGVRCYASPNGVAIFRLREHLDRFFYSASVLKMKLGFDKKQVAQGIKDLIKANGITSGYIRPMAFYSEPKMGINILGSRVTFVIFAWKHKNQKQAKAIRLYITKYKRLSPQIVDIKAKISGYYANSLLGFLDAQSSGYDQPLFLDAAGYLAEGAINNIFIVKNKTLYTPTDKNILNGITRDTVMAIAKNLKLKVVERNIQPSFLKKAGEIFLTGTGVQLLRVKEVKGYYKNNKESTVVDLISKDYEKITRGQIKKYNKWLTIV